MEGEAKLFYDEPNEVREDFGQFFNEVPGDVKKENGKSLDDGTDVIVPESPAPEEGKEGAGMVVAEGNETGPQRRRGRPRKGSDRGDVGKVNGNAVCSVALEGAAGSSRMTLYGNREFFDKVKYVAGSRGISMSDYVFGLVVSRVDEDYSALSAEDLELIRRYNERFGGMKQ